jgi:diketogulonate reductase-like aldo/keto reductase
MRFLALPDGGQIPVLGLGTWRMGERGKNAGEEEAALRLGIDLGMTLIDTAEMYGDGGAEEIVGKAISGRRDAVYLVSKVLPQNADRKGAIAACEKSLRRLGTDHLDLYLLHWRGSVSLAETVETFERLRGAGKIRHWGVSNFELADMKQFDTTAMAVNQLLYNLTRRSIEWDLLPWCRNRGIPVMAYSPVEQGRLLRNPSLRRLADQRQITPAQLALAWVLHQPGVVAIPMALNPAHLHENRAAMDITLTAQDLAGLDRAFPPPIGPVPLEML